MRSEISRFAEAMSDVMNGKQSKYGDGWKTMDVDDLNDCLHNAYNDYQEAEEELARRLLHLGNYVMMLWNRIKLSQISDA